MGIARGVLIAVLLSPLAAMAADGAPLFHAKVEVRRIDEGEGPLGEDTTRSELAGSTASLREALELGLSFDVGPRMQPLRRSLSSTYSWKRNLVHTKRATALREETGDESGTRLVDWDVAVERRFRPVACEDVLVRDRVFEGRERSRTVAPAAGPSGVHLRLTATWPGKVQLRDRQAGVAPFSSETLPVLDVDMLLPYDLESSSKPSRLAFVSRVPATDAAPESSRSWYVELDLAPVAPHEFSLSAQVQQDGTLALRNRIVVGGRDVAAAYQVRRVERTWEIREEAGLAPEHELASDWRVVTESGARPASQHLFFDPVDPASFTDRRWLVEVLEMVEGLPELGLLYHQLRMETRRVGAHFHVSATEARPVSPATWCEIKRRRAPATDEAPLVGGGPLRVLAESTYDSGGLATR